MNTNNEISDIETLPNVNEPYVPLRFKWDQIDDNTTLRSRCIRIRKENSF